MKRCSKLQAPSTKLQRMAKLQVSSFKLQRNTNPQAPKPARATPGRRSGPSACSLLRIGSSSFLEVWGLRLEAFAATVLLSVQVCSLKAAEAVESDVCIYGGTAGGVAAAVQATRMGKRAVIAEFGQHLGGMTSGGLGATDIGNKAAIGGIAREFYHRVARHYARDDAWQFEKREDYFEKRATRATLDDLKSPGGTMWTFEPHVAENILLQWVKEAKVPVHFEQRLASVKKTGARITEIAMRNGKVYRARMFIDATYEGDLMVKVGVSYTVGREANAIYNETINGVRAETPKHQFLVPVDP